MPQLQFQCWAACGASQPLQGVPLGSSALPLLLPAVLLVTLPGGSSLLPQPLPAGKGPRLLGCQDNTSSVQFPLFTVVLKKSPSSLSPQGLLLQARCFTLLPRQFSPPPAFSRQEAGVAPCARLGSPDWGLPGVYRWSDPPVTHPHPDQQGRGEGPRLPLMPGLVEAPGVPPLPSWGGIKKD